MGLIGNWLYGRGNIRMFIEWDGENDIGNGIDW
jgi:hypothetical protein